MSDDFDALMDSIQEEINEDTRQDWGEEAFERWNNPPNRGVLPEADVSVELRGSCGDAMTISLFFEGEKVGAATFDTDGCGPSVICGSLAAEMAVGKTAEELLDISGEQVLDRAGNIPEDHHHCAFLAASVLHEAVNRKMGKGVK
jgi:NifU-like protein involved in Fe-S cluster formation